MNMESKCLSFLNWLQAGLVSIGQSGGNVKNLAGKFCMDSILLMTKSAYLEIVYSVN